MTLVLASSSPQRLALLRAAGVEPVVDPADVDETPLADEPAGALVVRLARAKAAVVAARRPGAVVLGSDTVVAHRGVVLGKPDDDDAAAAMLARIAGDRVRVLSGVAVVRDDEVADGLVSTVLRMRPLDPDGIADYVATGEPRGAAGALRVQGLGGGLVAARDGCWTGVVGLPTCLAADLLAPHDVVLARDDCPPRA